MPDPTPTRDTTHEDERRRRLDREREAVAQLARLNGALELHAAVLALLLPAGSRRALKAWQIDTEATPNAAALLEPVNQLSGPARLPWLETLASRMRDQPLGARQALLEATRRVMGARGVIRPIDRLHWFAMRQWLGEASVAASTRAPAEADLSRLPQSDVSAIATYSAFLARMVPADAADTAPTPQGIAWYDTVMAPWQAHATVAPCQVPSTDALVHALQELQALAWMQRPLIVRGWVGAAHSASRYGRFADGAADALRLSCALLDSPQPPELARHYGPATPEPPR